MPRNTLLGSQRFYEILEGCSRFCKVPKCLQNDLKGFEKFLRVFRNQHGPEDPEMLLIILKTFWKVILGAARIFKVPEGSMMFHRNTQSCTVFHKVPPVSTRFHEVRVSGFPKVLWGSPRFSDLPMDLTGFQQTARLGSLMFPKIR